MKLSHMSFGKLFILGLSASALVLFAANEVLGRKTVVVAASASPCFASLMGKTDLNIICPEGRWVYGGKNAFKKVGLAKHRLKTGQHTVWCVPAYDVSANLEIPLPYTEGRKCSETPNQAELLMPGGDPPGYFFNALPNPSLSRLQ